MSLETTIMKNLIDLGIIEKGENISSSYKSPDGNYIINLNRKHRLSFLSQNTDSNYLCSIEILSSMNSPILSIQTTELDISRLIDEIYSLTEYHNGDSRYHYFNPNTTNCIPKVLGLYPKGFSSPVSYIDYNQYYSQLYNPYYLLEIFDQLDDQLVKRISLTLAKNDIDILLEKMYYTFLIDVSDTILHPELYPDNFEEKYYNEDY